MIYYQVTKRETVNQQKISMPPDVHQSSFWLDLSSIRTFREELVTGRKVKNVELTKDRLHVCAWAAQILILPISSYKTRNK